MTVAVEYSTVNYKDGLAICNGAPVVRSWPLVPGIDLAGVVETSTHPDWQPGDRVTVNGWDLGEKHFNDLTDLLAHMGRHGAENSRGRRMADATARGNRHPRRGRHRHRGLHRHALRAGLGPSHPHRERSRIDKMPTLVRFVA